MSRRMKDYEPHPFRLYRPTRLAELLGCDLSTLHVWRKRGILPPPKKIGGIRGWTEEQLQQLFAQQNKEP